MTKNTHTVQSVNSSDGVAMTPKTAKKTAVDIKPTPQRSESENCAAPAPPPKLTRAQRREQNQIKLQQVMMQEIAASNKVPVQTAVKATGEGDMLPASIGNKGGKGGKAKRVTAVMGRPSEYTPEEGDAICAWIAEGGSLNMYCRKHSRDNATVYRWLREHADFHARYAQAHEDRADTLVDQMVEIADDSQHAESIEQVTAARLRVETRKWIAQKMRSQKYGDKVEVKQTGAVSINIGLSAPKPAETIDVTDMSRIIGPSHN